MESINPNPSLPEEIINEILTWLPVKSLLRFGSVSKPWLSLISTSQFIKSHISKSIENTRFTHHKLILEVSPYPNINLKACSVYSLLNEPVFEDIEVDYPMKKNYNKFGSIIGSCNGLVCVIKKKRLFLWNPSTRKSRLVPTDPSYIDWDNYTYGIGCDESNDDFKVVEIFWDDHCHGYKNKVKLYSSKSDCWRWIEDFPIDEPSENYGKFVNGALHWEANTDKVHYSWESWMIVSLDMKTETYGEVSQPKYEEGKYDLTLRKLNESLSVLCSYIKTRADIWIMKEYGVKESWTKLVTIPYMDGICCERVLHISVNGDILLDLRHRLLLYSSKDKKFKRFTNFSLCREGDIYIESLVSPIAQTTTTTTTGSQNEGHREIPIFAIMQRQ